MLHLTINGAPFAFPAGTLLLHALQAAGASVPHLCHDDRLKPYGGCRLCLVEIDGEAKPALVADWLSVTNVRNERAPLSGLLAPGGT